MALILNPSTITFTAAKSRVCKTAGVDGDTDWAIIAGDAIVDALHQWNISRDWSWLQTTATDIPLVTNTSTYDLPAPFNKPFDARIGSSYLIWMPQRYYDKANPANTGVGPWYYTMFNTPTTGKIELLPPVGTITGTVNLSVRYWRVITKPVAGGDLLDIPAKYEDGIIALAKSLLLADKGGDDTRMNFWSRRAQTVLNQAIIDEEKQGDYDATFVSESFTGNQGWNPNSLTLALDYL